MNACIQKINPLWIVGVGCLMVLTAVAAPIVFSANTNYSSLPYKLVLEHTKNNLFSPLLVKLPPLGAPIKGLDFSNLELTFDLNKGILEQDVAAELDDLYPQLLLSFSNYSNYSENENSPYEDSSVFPFQELYVPEGFSVPGKTEFVPVVATQQVPEPSILKVFLISVGLLFGFTRKNSFILNKIKE